jgi:acetyl-CoA carboxylase biotin carboxyl carrier protein
MTDAHEPGEGAGMDDGRSPARQAASDAAASVPSGGNGSLLAILDRLTGLLERSDLTELEVESGGTGLVLRKSIAIAAVATVAAGSSAVTPSAGSEPAAAPAGEGPSGTPSVKAPLTGIYYSAPGPGSASYVQVGGEVAVGQVIGLIEAMKLFNEIKSDLAGRVVRVVAESGQLVKAKQPLIEVEPL